MEEIARPEKPSEKYLNDLLEMWRTVLALEIEVKNNLLKGQADLDPVNKLVAVATTLWKELYPKVVGTELEDQFLQYKEFYLNPMEFLTEKNFPKLLDFLLMLRIVLENLGVTQTSKG